MSLPHAEPIDLKSISSVNNLTAAQQDLFLDCGRDANTFAVELLETYGRDGDLTDSVVLAALVQSTTAAVASDPHMERRYGIFDAPLPEDLHQAISVNALATSLGLPFETVRRRLKRLTAEGLCAASPGGLHASDRLLTSGAHRQTLDSICDSVRRLYGRLGRAKAIQRMDLRPPAEVAPFGGDPPVRIVYRAATRHFLRTMELLLPQFSNVTQASIGLEILAANTEVLAQALRGGRPAGSDPDHGLADGCGRPMRVGEVAARLSLPLETVRRQLGALVEEGRCRRVPGGTAPAALLGEPKVVAVLIANAQNLRRLFVDLAPTGVLARWDAEQVAESPA